MYESQHDNLSILYAEYDEINYFNQAIFKAFSSTFHSSVGHMDTLNKYHNFKEINNKFFDVVVLDNRFGLDICQELLRLNHTQKFVIKINLVDNKNLSTFYVNGFDNFIYEPLNRAAIEKAISLSTEQKDYANLLANTLQEQSKEMSDLLSDYEDKIEDSNKKLEERSAFFASMSHEIRTPMNAIIGLSQVLMEDASLNRNQLENIKTINRSSTMLLGIVNDILDFSKMEAGKLSLEKTSFDLNMILSYLADMTSLKAQEKGINLTFDINHNIGKNYLGDPLRISQILLNLLANAIKFTDKGGVILGVKTIDSVNGQATLEFSVKDTGIGLSDEALLKLFKSYSQASSNTTRKYGGTGLGLTISKQLVDIMHGEIWVDSIEGEGSTFFVRINLDKDKEKRNYRLPSRDIMNMKAMIIDNNNDSIDSLKNLLSYFHISAQSISDIDNAKETLDEGKFNILFIDKSMYNKIDIQRYKIKNKFHVVLIEDWKDILINNQTDYSVIDEILKRPFHQQMIFDILSRLYTLKGISDKNIEQTDKTNKDTIKKLGKHHILIAEDNIINQKVLSELLSDTELKLTFADDGQKALNILKEDKHKFELVFMDINMPNLDGYMTTQLIRQDSVYDNLIIIGLSGHTSDEDLEKAINVGMQDYLLKPIDIQALYSTLTKYLKIKIQ